MPPDGIELDGEPICHLAQRQDVVIWPLEPVERTARALPKRHLVNASDVNGKGG